MKKFMTLMLTMVMIFSLAACGGNAKKDEATDAFNAAVTVFDETTALINENMDILGDDELIATFTEMADIMTSFKEHLESDEELTDEEYDEMIVFMADVETKCAEIKASFEGVLEDMEGFSDEDIALTKTAAVVLGTWDFCGGYFDGAELNDEEATAVLEQYGGTLQLQFNQDATAAMVQGGGTLEGAFDLIDAETVAAVFDNAGQELAYTGELTELDGTPIMMLTLDGIDYIYFAKIA